MVVFEGFGGGGFFFVNVGVICMFFKVGVNVKLKVYRIVVVGYFWLVVMIGGFGVGFCGFEFCINYCLKVFIGLRCWYFYCILMFFLELI